MSIVPVPPRSHFARPETDETQPKQHILQSEGDAKDAGGWMTPAALANEASLRRNNETGTEIPGSRLQEGVWDGLPASSVSYLRDQGSENRAPGSGGPSRGRRGRTLVADGSDDSPPKRKSPSPPGAAPVQSPATEDPKVAKLEGEIRGLPKNQMSADAKTEFDKLLKDSNFDNLGPDSKIAILSQVKHHPNALSIAWLTRLCNRASFSRPLGKQALTPDQLLEYRQRLAKLVAFAGDYYKPGEYPEGLKILVNSYTRLLERGGPDFRFAPELKDDILGEYNRDEGVLKLNPRFLPAGNGPLTGDESQKLAAGTAPHEVNHYVNSPLGGFVGETRAFWAGFQSWNKRKPTNAEMLDICNKVVEHYPDIQSDIKTNNQKTDIDKKRAKYEREAYSAYLKVLKAGNPADPAPPPVSVIPGDPKNLDNSAP
jgi:hypothetical protein